MANIISKNFFSCKGRKNKSKEVYMLEKVRVGFQISITKLQLENWGYRFDKAKQGQEMETHYTYWVVSKGALTKVVFNQPNYQYPLPMLHYVLSLPKTIWRNNVPLFSNDEDTSATEKQRQARSCHYMPGTQLGNTQDKDNYRE